MEHNIEDMIAIAKDMFLGVRIYWYMLHSEICMFGAIENGKNFCLQKFTLLKPSPLYRKDQNCPPSCARGKISNQQTIATETFLSKTY